MHWYSLSDIGWLAIIILVGGMEVIRQLKRIAATLERNVAAIAHSSQRGPELLTSLDTRALQGSLTSLSNAINNRAAFRKDPATLPLEDFGHAIADYLNRVSCACGVPGDAAVAHGVTREEMIGYVWAHACQASHLHHVSSARALAAARECVPAIKHSDSKQRI